MSAITRTPEAPDVEGRVAEVIPAGSYAYLRVGDAWFATLDHQLSVGDPVHLDPVGKAATFVSKRTGHTFQDLWFAAVSPQPEIP